MDRTYDVSKVHGTVEEHLMFHSSWHHCRQSDAINSSWHQDRISDTVNSLWRHGRTSDAVKFRPFTIHKGFLKSGMHGLQKRFSINQLPGSVQVSILKESKCCHKECMIHIEALTIHMQGRYVIHSATLHKRQLCLQTEESFRPMSLLHLIQPQTQDLVYFTVKHSHITHAVPCASLLLTFLVCTGREASFYLS